MASGSNWIGFVLARRPAKMSSWAVTVVAVLVTLFAGYGIWPAVATIISQRASRTLEPSTRNAADEEGGYG